MVKRQSSESLPGDLKRRRGQEVTGEAYEHAHGVRGVRFRRQSIRQATAQQRGGGADAADDGGVEYREAGGGLREFS